MNEAASMSSVTNISCYRFASLTDLKSLREQLLTLCKAGGLKGTILLSTEGVNMFVAGPQKEVDALVDFTRRVPGLEGLAPKYSESEEQPFRRMLVRIKKEIIAFGVEGIDPATHTSPRLEARTLKQWLDEGRPVTLFDTRNDYEIKLGTFKGAIPAGIDTFRDFPEAVRRLPEHLKKQPIVTFCTGGIRCEKAAPFMEREGFENIYQLEGGILKYFEEVGGAHYEGECFVFDQRVGLDPGLEETSSTQCYVCQTPLTAEDQADPRYVSHVSCPYCFKTTEQQMRESIATRQEALRRFTTPLPGSEPYDNRRPLSVTAEYDGQTLIDFLCGILSHIPREEWLTLIDQGRFLDPSHQPAQAMQIVRAGERYLHLLPQTREPDVSNDVRILHEDEAILVLHKPAPLPMHPCGRYNRHTLQNFLHHVYAPQHPRPAHRLDANTTGLVVYTRTRHFARILQPQFTRGEVDKAYLVRVQGQPDWEEHVCEAPISDEAGDLGSREIAADGQQARTEFIVQQRFSDGTSLLIAKPRTGRTNQIRVHLWHLGLPVCGDQAYLPDMKLGDTQTLTVSDEPLCLHAWRLGFRHPLTGERTEFEDDRPPWATA